MLHLLGVVGVARVEQGDRARRAPELAAVGRPPVRVEVEDRGEAAAITKLAGAACARVVDVSNITRAVVRKLLPQPLSLSFGAFWSLCAPRQVWVHTALPLVLAGCERETPRGSSASNTTRGHAPKALEPL